MRLRHANNSRKLRAPGIADLDFELVAQAIPVIVSPGSSSSVESEDQLVTTRTGATYYHNYAISRVIHSDTHRVVERSPIESLHPAVGSYASGLLSRVGDGYATAKVRTPLGSRGVQCDMTQYTNATVQIIEWAPGYLASEATAAITSRATGDPATVMPLYSAANHTTPSYTRNTSFWAADVNLTSISPSNAASGPYRAGVAVTAKHVLYARHYPLAVGDVLRFVTMDNQVVTRSVAAIAELPYVGSWTDSDIGIASLASDLPASITPVKVPPATLEAQLPNLSQGLLAWGTDAQELGVIRQLLVMSGDALSFSSRAINPDMHQYYEDYISGDSGSPVFLIVDGELLLLCVISTGNNGQGTAIWRKLAAINSLISGLDPGYALTQMNLDAYPSF